MRGVVVVGQRTKHSNWGMAELAVAQATGLGERTILEGARRCVKFDLPQVMINGGFGNLEAVASHYRY